MAVYYLATASNEPSYDYWSCLAYTLEWLCQLDNHSFIHLSVVWTRSYHFAADYYDILIYEIHLHFTSVCLLSPLSNGQK